MILQGNMFLRTFCLVIALIALATRVLTLENVGKHAHHALRDVPQHHDKPSLVSSATQSDIDAARKLVKTTIRKMSRLNKARLDKPARNKYKLQPGTKLGRRADDAPDPAPPPLLEITDDIAYAAALVAEADAAANSNGTSPAASKRAGTYWMEHISRKGGVPWGNDPNYKVFRNVVTDFGADPTGATDSSTAIRNAMAAGGRCGEKCNGATTKNAIVYFPPGTYMVTRTIEVFFGTQVIGDAISWPTIKAAGSFVGLGVLSTSEYVPNGGTGPDGRALQWYINTARFYSQIRNIKIDITATDPNAYVCCIHYQVAQATSLESVELVATTGTTQQGMFSENGSGGVMSDVTFRGGNFGFYGGNQQFTAQRMHFIGCKTAVQIIWDWGWVWKSLLVEGGEVGFRLINEGGDGNIGSVSFIDSQILGVATAIIMAPPSQTPGSGTTGLILDNTKIEGKIVDTAGNQLLASGNYKNWVIGPVYKDNVRTWTAGKSVEYPRQSSLQGGSQGPLQAVPYFERKKNQYLDKAAGDFVHLKDLGVKGDGSTDDTAALQSALNTYKDGNKIIFVDAGTYMLNDTVVVPKNAKLHGETWSQFVAVGPKFSDSNSPHVMLQVGNDGDVGNVEMQDLILTTKGGTAGAVLMQWNVKAETQGSAALWDVHARVGGATGTSLNPSDCPALVMGTNGPACQAASLLMHITSKASGYFDNMWLWVADHLIDDPDLTSAVNPMTQLSVYVARGLLIESTSATWLYGTSAEHCVFYQYNFNGAQNIFTTMIQTEPPYYQPEPRPPAPFTNAVGKISGDPTYNCGNDFDGCDEAWAVILTKSQNIHIGGAGTYSWFSKYTQDCIDVHTCQKTLWYVKDNYDNVRIQHLIGIGAKYLIGGEGSGILSTDNLAITAHPAWAQISVYDALSKGKAPGTPGSYPNCTATYTTLDQIEADKANIPIHCMNLYIAIVLRELLKKGVAEYETILANDYEAKFALYAEYIKEITPDQIKEYMTTNGSHYFSCFETSRKPCCQGCSSQIECAGCDSSSTCGTYVERPMAACPTSIPSNSANSGRPNEVRYQLNNETGFKGELLDYQGIEPNWTTLGKLFIWNYKPIWTGPLPAGCCPTCTFPGASCVLYYYNFPVATNFTVKDPQDDLGEAMPKIKQIIANLDTAIGQLQAQTYQGNTSDIINGVSIPISFVLQAVEQMKSVVAASSEIEEIRKQQQIALILALVGAFISVVPFVGSALRQASLAGLGKIIMLVGETTSLALNIYGASGSQDGATIIFLLMDIITVVGPKFSRAAELASELKAKYPGLSFLSTAQFAQIAQISRIVATFSFV